MSTESDAGADVARDAHPNPDATSALAELERVAAAWIEWRQQRAKTWPSEVPSDPIQVQTEDTEVLPVIAVTRAHA